MSHCFFHKNYFKNSIEYWCTEVKIGVVNLVANQNIFVCVYK